MLKKAFGYECLSRNRRQGSGRSQWGEEDGNGGMLLSWSEWWVCEGVGDNVGKNGAA